MTSGFSTPNPFFFNVNLRCWTAEGVMAYTLPMAGFDMSSLTIIHNRMSSIDRVLKRARIFEIRRSSISSSNCSTFVYSFDVIRTWGVLPFSFIVMSVRSIIYLCKYFMAAFFFCSLSLNACNFS